MKDFCLTDDNVFLVEERDLLVQQIDMLFDTTPNEVLGEEYGTNFYDFLWDLSASAADVTEYTKSVIYANINLMDWDLEVETNLLQGTQNDIILITIRLSKYNMEYEKTYKVD